MHYYWLKSRLYSDFLTFYLMFFFFLFQDPTITFSHHVSWGSTCLWQFFGLSSFWMTLTVWKSTGQVFCRMSLNWDLADVFLVVRLKVRDLGRRPQRWRALFSTYQEYIISICIKSTYGQHDSSLLMLTSLTGLKSHLPGFRAAKLLLFFSLFPYCTL